MVQKIRVPGEDMRAALERARKARGERIAERYVLYEVSPPYTISGYYEVEVPKKRVRVTDGTQQEISEFTKKHKPDDGKWFEIRREGFYEATVVTRTWYDEGVVSPPLDVEL
jgi:hypothetical protein